MNDATKTKLREAIESDDRTIIRALLRDRGDQAGALNEPGFLFGKPLLAAARSVDTARLLIEVGARPEPVGAWWAPGFYTKAVATDVARFLVERGAPLTPHAAAGLGLGDELAAMIQRDGGVVHAKGGDGGTPLHFARDVEVARLLVEHGATLDPRDDDHESTPIQWLIGDRSEVVRYLLEQGATADIFVAAALNDLALARRLIGDDPGCPAYRIGKDPFPGIGHQPGHGGTILQWSLAFNSYAHQVAKTRGHGEMFQLLWDASDDRTRLLVACLVADRASAEAIASAHPEIVPSLDERDLDLVAKYSWETNANVEAVRLMLDLGFPVDTPEHNHGWKPMHNAAWGGYGEIVELLIERGHPLSERDPEHQGTPLAWAQWCALEVGRHPEGDYDRVVGALIDAGARWDPAWYPTGDEGIDKALLERLPRRIEGAALLGDVDAVEKLLESSPDPEQLACALIGAAKGGHRAMCERLLEAGAEIRKAGDMGSTALHKAVEAGHVEIVDLLMARGANIAMRNGVQSTVLHVAGWNGGRREMIETLVRHGADAVLEAKNQWDCTALGLAVSAGHPEAEKVFRELGATDLGNQD